MNDVDDGVSNLDEADIRLQRRIHALVQEIIRVNTGRELELGLDDALISSGYLDSMSMVNLVIALQTELHVDLDVTDMSAANFETIRTITRLAAARID